MKVLLIIPAYNEEASILGVVRGIEKAGYDYVVIIDGATDRTLDICRDNSLNYINLPINMGIGGAVQTGHMYALRHGYDIDIQVDGDGQHDISYVPDLVEAIQNGADLAIGSRFVEQTDGFQSSGARRAGVQSSSLPRAILQTTQNQNRLLRHTTTVLWSEKFLLRCASVRVGNHLSICAAASTT